MIIDKEKLIFVHIPKNAGSAIKRLFFEKDELETPFKHKTIHEIKKENPKEYDSYKKFAIVRNPYDRTVSWYAYQRKYRLDTELTDYNDNLHTYQYINGEYKIIDTAKAPIDAFKSWITLDHYELQKDDHLFKQQYAWVDETVVILKYENLNKELNDFLGKKIELSPVNETSRYDTLDYYDKESLDIIYNKYKEDFEKFNYKKI
jgi:hypothetical protein